MEEGAYESLAAFLEDFDLMFENAMAFNAPRSQPYIDAKALKYGLEIIRDFPPI